MKKQLLKKFYSCLPALRTATARGPLGMAFIVPVMMFSASANAQNVNIPDSVFKSKLVNNININTNGDGEIQVSEAANYNGEMDVSRHLIFSPNGHPIGVAGPAINDLTGIEAFVALTGLDCSRNNLTNLNISSNISLKTLNCQINPFTMGLSVSANTALTMLVCNDNNLTSLDLSANTALDSLFCSGNQLTSLDVSANTLLKYLYCCNNQLTSLDVTANTALTTLSIYNNQLTSMDVSANTLLKYLYCYKNQLTSLDVSANTVLRYLYCHNNQLTSLDVSQNTTLSILLCGSNQLTNLNVQNGNNWAFSDFNAINNPSLFCIQVDNVGYSNANWNFIDSIAGFSTNCAISSVSDIDNSTVLQLFPNPANNHLAINLGSNNKRVEVNIADITGKIIYTTTSTDVQKVEVNTNDFAAGTYIVQIQTADFIGTRKLVIEK
jgi:uncharacterized protein